MRHTTFSKSVPSTTPPGDIAKRDELQKDIANLQRDLDDLTFAKSSSQTVDTTTQDCGRRLGQLATIWNHVGEIYVLASCTLLLLSAFVGRGPG